jgi:Mg2+-importing ATPase
MTKLIRKNNNQEIIERKIKIDQISDKLLKFGLAEKEIVLEKLNSSLKGLTNQEVEFRIEEYGKNEISHGNEETLPKRLIAAFINPFSIVLIILAIVSFITDYIIALPVDKDLTTVIIIGAMITISGTLHFVQEGKSNKAGEKLKGMINTTATVERSGTINEIPIAELVPGDIVRLAAGDMIPADVRIIYAKDLFVSQSSMTGEAEPLEKHANIQKATLVTCLN